MVAVYIKAEPAEHSIAIHNGVSFKLVDNYLMLPGNYRITIQSPGYHSLKEELSISKEKSQSYHYELERLPGHLMINLSSSIDAASIYIDGEEKGTVPATINNIPYGKHTLRVEAKRYLPYEQQIKIEGLDQTQQIDITLTPAWGDISFSSEPSAADIFVDDELVGQTPLTSEILQGEHQIRIELSGYKPWQTELKVAANTPETIPEVKLAPADAILRISSKPDKASVTINQQYRGQTPLETGGDTG